MTLDEIIHQLRSAAMPPADAMRAGLPQAAELAPHIYEQLARFCRGVCLLPSDENQLFYGLHVLAAARQPELWPRLVEFARVPEEELHYLFQHNAENSLAALMVSVWDGDTDALIRLIEHADMSEIAKNALFGVLARLTFDGRITREETAAFLERFEQEGLAEEESLIWFGWEQAVTALGLTALQPALTRVWLKPACADLDANDKAEALAELSKCAADPQDSSAFDARDIKAIDDPVAALAWIERSVAALAAWQQEAAGHPSTSTQPDEDRNEDQDDDPAGAIRPHPGELAWLERFLVSRQVPAATMSLLMLDGYLMAVTIGPLEIQPSSYMPPVWGEDGSEPTWEAGLRDLVAGLLIRQCLSIRMCYAAGAEQRPLVEQAAPDDTHDLAAEWAEGFAIGMELAGDAWEPIFKDKRGAEDALAVLALCEGETEFLGRPATASERTQIIERLPRILQRIAAYWRSPTRTYPGSAPVRVQKVGRNDPCPCGSGKKYKKCCALNPPPTLN